MRNNKFAVLAAFFILCAVNALGQGITADSLAVCL